MIYDVSHKTVYRYTTPVVRSQHVVHMSPRMVERQKVKGHTLLVDPAPTLRTERDDYYGNRVVLFDIEQEHEELTVHAKSTIVVVAREPVDLPGSAPEPRGEHRRGSQAALPGRSTGSRATTTMVLLACTVSSSCSCSISNSTTRLP